MQFTVFQTTMSNAWVFSEPSYNMQSKDSQNIVEINTEKRPLTSSESILLKTTEIVVNSLTAHNYFN